MKVVILAGGFGTRLAEVTDQIPKPMVMIGGFPIIWHIMNIYAKAGYSDFILALGYKSEVIKKYFTDYYLLQSDLSINLSSGAVVQLNPKRLNWNVTLVNTGLHSMTGGRLLRVKDYLDDKTFMVTYGDGLSDIDINQLVEFHRANGKAVTVSAVHPAARFGELEISNNLVKEFKEKPQTQSGWINGGFFVMEPRFLEYIEGDNTVLEAEPLEQLAKQGELTAYKHNGFWQCMDTIRDKNYLEELWQNNNAPWKVS